MPRRGRQMEDLLKLLAVHHRAAGIGRRIDDHHLGARGEMRLDHRGGQGEAVLLVGIDEDALAARRS